MISRIGPVSAFAAASLLAALLAACGPTTFTKVRVDWQPVEGSSPRQDNENVTVDVTTPAPAETSPELMGTLQKCAVRDTLEYSKSGKPVTETLPVTTSGQLWRRVAITSRDEHILRLNGVVARLFTPDGREWEPLSRDKILAAFRANRPCPSSDTAANAFSGVRLLQKGVEILPGATGASWLAFTPPSAEDQPGVWKLGLYEVPVKTNDVGKVAKTARFEFRYQVIKYVDTYRQKNWLATPELIESTEVPPAK
jgi:hypothetical protein